MICDLRSELALGNPSSPASLQPNGSLCFEGAPAEASSARQRSVKQLLQDVSTEVVVTQSLASPDTSHAFVSLFADCYGNALAANGIAWDQAPLVYKGGNVLVEYFHELLGSNILYANGDSKLKFALLTQRSDADFTVIVPLRSEALRPQINSAVRNALAAFRTFLQVGPSTKPGRPGLLYLPTAQDYASHAATYNAVLGPTGFRVVQVSTEHRPDLAIKPGNRPRCATHISFERSTGGVDAMYMSFNETLESDVDVDNNSTSPMRKVQHFDLARLKANVVLSLKHFDLAREGCVMAPAELVDVSIARSDDVHAMELGGSLDDWTVPWSYDGRVTNLRIPTLEHLVHTDLDGILFRFSKYPWADAKYAKRLARYVVGVCIIELRHSDTAQLDTTLGSVLGTLQALDIAGNSSRGLNSSYSNNVARMLDRFAGVCNRVRVDTRGRPELAPELATELATMFKGARIIIENIRTLLFHMRMDTIINRTPR